jgi:hypothetical protein
MDDQDCKVVKYGEEHGKKFAEIYSPKGVKKLKVTFK